MTVNHERLLTLIEKAGTVPLGHILTYQEQDELLNAVGPLIEDLAQTQRERDAYLNDLRISNDVGHEWANRAQERAAALVHIGAMIPPTIAECREMQRTIIEVLGGYTS